MKQLNFKLGQTTKARSSSRVKIYAVILFVIVAAGAAATWLVLNRNAQPKPDNSAESVTEQINADKDSENSTETTNLPDNSSSITSDDVPTSSSLQVESPTFLQADGVVKVSARITGTTEEGTCVITFKTPDDRPVIRQLNSVAQQCSTSISEVEFQKIGEWNLNVTFYSGNSKAEANRNVTIK